jgi:hypothetical protein
MKVYAMMYRAKLKDMVDVALILMEGYTLEQLTRRAHDIFQDLYRPEYTYETILAKKRDMTEEITRVCAPIAYELLEAQLENAVRELL